MSAIKAVEQMLAVAKSNRRLCEVSSDIEANREFSYWCGKIEGLEDVLAMMLQGGVK